MDEAPKFGCHVSIYGDVGAALRYGVLVERLGLDVVSLPDHLFHPLGAPLFKEPAWDAFILLSAIGAQTKRVRLMTISDPVRRHPAVLAHMVSTLDHLTHGRAALALGAGELFNFLPLRELRWDKPFTRLAEAVRLIKGLWASTPEEPLNFHGSYFVVEDGYLGLKPLQKPHPPLMIAGYGPRMRGLVAREGDGWVVWNHSPRALRAELRGIREEAERLGREPGKIEVVVMLMTAVLGDGDEAWRRVSARVKAALALRPGLLRSMGYGRLADESLNLWRCRFTEEENRRLLELAERIPEEAVREVSVAGTPEEAIGHVERFVEAGATLILLIPIAAVFEETLRNYSEKIIPYFREGRK